VPLGSKHSPRKQLLVHLSQAVETLALRKSPGTHVEPLTGVLDGEVKVQFLEVSDAEFGHFEKVSNALIRLDKGTYGRCMRCGRRIESDVLSQAPWANRCAGCGDQESQP